MMIRQIYGLIFLEKFDFFFFFLGNFLEIFQNDFLYK